MTALAVRRSKAGHMALLRNWERVFELHSDALQEARGRMGGALRDALLGEDDQLFENSCAAIEYFSEFDVLPTLIAIAEHASRPAPQEGGRLWCTCW